MNKYRNRHRWHLLWLFLNLLIVLVVAWWRVDELERSLTTMKEQQSHLKEQLRLESERKKELKLELENDHVRIVELERQLKEKRRNRRKSLDPLTSNGDQGS